MSCTQLPDPAMMRAHPPVLAPCGRGLSLQVLARAGARLAGRLVAVDGGQVRFDDSAPANVAAGDAFAARVRAMIDELIRRTGVDAPPAEPDDADLPVEPDAPTELNLLNAGIGSIVWSTGFGADFSCLDPVPVDAQGRPRREEVASDTPGLFYFGLRWLTHRATRHLHRCSDVADAVATYPPI